MLLKSEAQLKIQIPFGEFRCRARLHPVPLGVLPMLKLEDEVWLSKAYPGLVPTDTSVAGQIMFEAAYDAQRHLFTILDENTSDDISGLVLAGAFGIRIEERTVKAFSSLPALFVQDIEPTENRHFGGDKTACLCSSLEEDEFLTPDFQFRGFLERLVIPFLYGQLFFSAEGRWPWSEYAHYATGLLESYGKFPDPSKAEELIQKIMKYDLSWPAVRSALRQKGYIKGHMACFCSKKDQIRRCHPNALRGIQHLQRDIKARKIPI